jgi:hypothetical protein
MAGKWIVGQPGGPAGPFWSVVASSGRIIAMQIIDKNLAIRIANIPERDDDTAALIELAEELIGYPSEYFQEKWRFRERLDELRSRLIIKDSTDVN